MAERAKIPVLLVTGFLGSGKTTLLRHLAQTHPRWRLVFLVNEFAETSVDGAALTATGTPTHSVVGGSLFCECKAADFLSTMRDRVLAWHRESPLDAVVIETSGTADPEAIGQLMSDHGLSAAFELRSIVTVVAPRKLVKLLGNLPVVEAQLRVSDRIVINKTDTVSAAELDAVEQSIRRLNGAAQIQRAEHCQIDFLIPATLATMPCGELSTCEANPFFTLEIAWPTGQRIAEATTWLRGLPDTILRVKGTIRTPEGCWRLERTVDGAHVEPAREADGTLVLIAQDDHEADLAAALETVPELSP